MNTERMQLMLTMLKEVQAGTWKPSVQAEPDGTNVYHTKVAFNLNVWAGTTQGCGFAACAVGHACLDKRFNDLGLHIQFTGASSGFPRYDGVGHTNTDDSWHHVAEFFKLFTSEAVHLFNPVSYRHGRYSVEPEPIRVEEVIARVEQALANQAAADDNLLKELGQ